MQALSGFTRGFEPFNQLPIHVRQLLQHYPTWQAAVAEALVLGPLVLDGNPTVVEIFDQQGLLAGRLYDYVYTASLPINHQSLFQAWYFDGELGIFYAGGEIIVNRMTNFDIAE